MVDASRREEGQHADREAAAMDEALTLLDAAVEQVRALGEPVSDSPVGPGAEAGENRAIRHARASFARDDARLAGSELAVARDRMREVLEQAHRSTDSSRDGRNRRRGATANGSALAGVLDRAARGLLERGEESLEHTLRLIVNGAIFSLEHATRAGISLVEPDGSITSQAPSDPVVADLDALQSRIGEGPCHDAVTAPPFVISHDLEVESRWPRFAPAARAHGITSMLSFQLFDRDGGGAGALNLYSDRARVFDEAAVEAGALFASHAALALYGARRTAQLNDALVSRDVIGQAKGILMERFGVGADQAFALLVSSSQDANMKLRAVSEWVVSETTRRHVASVD